MAAMLRTVADVASVVVLVAAWVIAARAYPYLPARIPIHFGFSGRADGWGRKQMIWMFPALGLGIYCWWIWIDGLVGRDAPGPAPAAALAWMRLYMLGLFYFIEARTIKVARGRATGLGRSFLPVTLAITFF